MTTHPVATPEVKETPVSNYEFQPSLTIEETRALARIARSKAANLGRAALENPLSKGALIIDAASYLRAALDLSLHANRMESLGEDVDD